MKYNPAKHHRRSIRLKNYDYTSAGAYFVTFCTKGHECVLDDPVVTGIILAVWHALPDRFPTIELDEFVVMPNHVHLIVWLLTQEDVGASLADAGGADARGADARGADVQDRARASLAPTAARENAEWIIPQPAAINWHPSLGDVIGAFKSLVFTVYRNWIETHEPERRAKFWQRNYYEHIIRSDPELNAIRRYIQDNPLHWNEDRDKPNNVRNLPLPAEVEDYLEDILLSLQE